MKTLKYVITIVTLGVLWSCNISPKPIVYGQDACHYCKMTIVDKIHAAEVVTNKGKVYMFDASECMIHFMDEFDTSQIALYLSNNYTNPEELIDATQATFLISEKVPSPMGANLSAFKNKEDAIKLQSKKGGDIYTWDALIKKFED
ncbi:MAG: hypothetical protein HKO92_08235 [Flavobacteriaceae bacterium]|nr:hypothetical protein [Flavobacteriaceae bacterium]